MRIGRCTAIVITVTYKRVDGMFGFLRRLFGQVVRAGGNQTRRILRLDAIVAFTVEA